MSPKGPSSQAASRSSTGSGAAPGGRTWRAPSWRSKRRRNNRRLEIVRRSFRSLALTGDLVKLTAILFGRPGGSALDPAEHGSYDGAILSVVRDEQGLDRIPIVTGMDFGHTDPAWTLPIGVRTRVDPRSRTVRMLEPAIVSESVR
jgi:hypothetical protein